MNPIFILIFIFGACVGSFLNVCIYRWPRELSIWSPRSFCPRCKRSISWYDNIPLVSFFVLAGQCRFCKREISFRYIFIEFLSAVLTLWIWIQAQEKHLPPVELFARLVLTYALMVVTLVDLEFFIIPNEVTYSGFILAVFTAVIFPIHMKTPDRGAALLQSLVGSLAGGGSLWVIGWLAKFFVKKEAMGLGDVKLMGMVGAWLGWKAVLGSIMMASIVGSVVGSLLVLMRKVRLESRIAFGPFLAIGSFVFMMWGESIMGWYIRFLYDFRV